MDVNKILLMLLCVILVLCFVLMIINRFSLNVWEGFADPEQTNDIDEELLADIKDKSPEELKQYIGNLKQRLVNYGYMPDTSKFVSKTELSPNAGKCVMSLAEDRDKYIAKADVPSSPRIDMSQYIKKSSLPPEKICPSLPAIDMSAYVKKSTLPPEQKCPECICPKVKVSAGLCRECPPPPKCPPPQACPVVKCPPQQPCPVKECPKCSDVKYIKVPAVISKTVVVDDNEDNNNSNNNTLDIYDTNNTNDSAVSDDYKLTDTNTTTTKYLTTPGSDSTGADVVSSAEKCVGAGCIGKNLPQLNSDWINSGGWPGFGSFL
jgi:hypothetical protein